MKVCGYVERPRFAKAICWNGVDYGKLKRFCCSARRAAGLNPGEVYVMCAVARPGDYIVEKERGNFSVMDKKRFEQNYNEVNYGC